ncbi:MAG: hypothetical protein ACE5G3_04425 [Gammaproteobacteria bacterium]
MTEPANSGIVVLEGPVRGQRIPMRRESAVAFVGSAPRGPVGIPVAVLSVDEYRRRFGAPGHRSRAQDLLGQFFENGGTNAIFVRVSASGRRRRIVMPAPAGELVLTACNPGPHECLRASVDYDGIPAGDEERFNLVIHRLASRDKPVVTEQEIYRAISVDPGDPDFVTQALIDSKLARVAGATPLSRPAITRCPGVEPGASYQYADDEWHEHSVLTDYDLIGCNTDGTGIFALDRVPVVDALCLVPDADDLGPVALFAAERYCRSRHAMLFVDPPASWQSVADVVGDRMHSGFSSPNVATYFPRPASVAGTGPNRTPSALGALVGRLVAGDAEKGVWHMRGRDSRKLRCRFRLVQSLDAREQAALNRLGVNTLCERPGYLRASGLVTLDGGSGMRGEWRDLALRRLALFIVGSIARGTRWAAFADDDEKTREDLRRQVTGFMDALHTAGALSVDGSGADWYFIRDHDRTAGGKGFTVGFALVDGAFTAYRFVQDRRDCCVLPVGWQAGVALTG